MWKVLNAWYKKYLSDPQAVVLTILLIGGFTVVITMGNMLMPALAALVIAYLLEGIVKFLEKHGAVRFRAVLIVFFAFMAFLFFISFGVAPLISDQLTQFIKNIPEYIGRAQSSLMQIPQHVSFISEQQIQDFAIALDKEIATFGQKGLKGVVASLPGVITIAVYLVLVPVMVFFFLKDKYLILNWFTSFLPQERQLAGNVWKEVDHQIGEYIRGKFWEIIIVGAATFIAFAVMKLQYSILLGVLVGLSVLIPYIGAAVVTIPVAMVAYFQWGWTPAFGYLMLVYGIIQAIDGNVLVPLLFSEVVNLHPIAIILSILVFGGIWGFWGVFFAIPLATLVSALLKAWPRTQPEPVT